VTEPIVDEEGDLPTEAVLDQTEDGWSIRLPLRSEAINVRKQVVVSERVVVRRVMRSDVERIETSVRRERLRVDTPSVDTLDASSRAVLEPDAAASSTAEPAEPQPVDVAPVDAPAATRRRRARRSTRRR
jgi:hypothetical protein